jgi:hypothetical protein
MRFRHLNDLLTVVEEWCDAESREHSRMSPGAHRNA